ncbi:hypothetical protein CRE_30170 [Caenorhabditis remanei]|uniref:PAZ domain-containing protein n=1 Tax=Caenorhabditis remanei TaxID=31234 RepID=E3NE26_CAERE|nr:hypothetical protein CRE_30170 [Caenorhabditis remanei]
MAKLINMDSTPSAPSNICLFDTPPSQVAFRKGKWMMYTPTSVVDSKGPYTFNVFDSAHYFQLDRTYITFKLRLKNVQKAVPPADHPTISHVNFIGATFFDQVKLSFNNVMVYDSDHYAYKSYIQTLLGENSDTKEGFLMAAGWQEPGNDGARVMSETKDLDLCAPLLLEPFQTERLLIPNVNIQLTLYRNRDEFCLESATDTKAELEISDLKLYMRAIDVVSSAAIALETRLRTAPARYPFTVSKVKLVVVPEGRFELPFNTLYHDIIPRRIIIGILAPEISITKSSLSFNHHNVSEVQLDVGGTMYPSQPIQCDFANKNYAQAFARFYEKLGGVSNKNCPKISYKMYRSGYTFFVFDMSAVVSSNAWELVQSGSTQLVMRFSEKTPKGGLNIMALSQFDGMFEIDGFRNVNISRHH